MKRIKLWGIGLIGLAVAGAWAARADVVERSEKLPVGIRDGVVVASPGRNGFVHHKDGRLMCFRGNWSVQYSSDGGRTWTSSTSLDVPAKRGSVSSVVRLKSGKLGLFAVASNDGQHAQNRNFVIDSLNWYISDDEGKTWSKPVHMNASGQLGVPYHDTVIQTKSGRIIVPVRYFNQGHKGMYKTTGSYGVIRGQRKKIEGHAHWPEMDVAFVYYSDDDGQTWWRSDREIVVWKDKGYGGMWPVDEPNVIELKDGRILMFARTSLGRIYQVHSPDGGNRWGFPEPTRLACSYSPCRLRRIPKTGDLICVWNQVSAEEIRKGFRRGRLSAAISKDDGKTWQNFKTIALAGLPAVGRVELEEPGMVRGRDDVGKLPDDYGNVGYANVAFHERTVLINFVGKLLILPLEWFYE